MTDVDLDPGCTLNKKIRNAQLAQYNFILGQWEHSFLSLSFSLQCCPVDIDLFSFLSFFMSFLVLACCPAGKSGGREREDEQHGERTHPRQQSPRRAQCGGVHRAPQTAQGFQEQKRRGGVLSFLQQLLSTKTSTDLKIPRG